MQRAEARAVLVRWSWGLGAGHGCKKDSPIIPSCLYFLPPVRAGSGCHDYVGDMYIMVTGTFRSHPRVRSLRFGLGFGLRIMLGYAPLSSPCPFGCWLPRCCCLRISGSVSCFLMFAAVCCYYICCWLLLFPSVCCCSLLLAIPLLLRFATPLL